MIKKAIILIFIMYVLLINSPSIFADSSMYYSDDFGNIAGGSPSFSGQSAYYEWDKFDPAQRYIATTNMKGLTNEKIIVRCEETTNKCYLVEGDTQKEFTYRRPPQPNNTTNKAPPVNYFTQDCIDKGFITVPNYPFTYKCSEDKTAYYVCYKNQRLGYYIEPNPYPFTKPLETNKLRKAICDLTPATAVQEPQTETQVDQPTTDNSETITDASLFLSLIQKIGFIGFDNLKTNFSNSNVPKTNLRVPYFIINYGTDDVYRANDINVTVHLDENGFNLNEEIYALVVTPEYGDLITEINNFIKTENIEYINTQTYEPVITTPVDCVCKYKEDSGKQYNYIEREITITLTQEITSQVSKNSINTQCNTACTVDLKSSINSSNNNSVFEYENNSYKINTEKPKTVIGNYVLTTQKNKTDKIKFLPNGNTFQFTINKNNPNKKFVIVFLQKSEKKLNISYSNFYVLNNDEILSYSLCEANRVILSNLCDIFLNPECLVVKSCYNGYDLNYESIDLTEFIYSSKGGTNIATPPAVVTPPADTPPAGTIPEDTPPVGTQNYYSTRNNIGDACSNAGLTLNQWGCVCIIQNSGKKIPVAAKCRPTYNLVLYGAPDKGRVSATYQYCYNEPSTKCR